MDGSDLDAMALQARRALSATADGTLLIAGATRAGAQSVLLYDDDGEPRFLCEAGSLLARAGIGRRSATLDVSCCARTGCRRRIVFSGRLVPHGRDEVDGTEVHIIGLALDVIRVHQPAGGPIDVPVAHYRRQVGDIALGSPRPESSMADYAHRIVEHTNASHGAELRDAAATIAGVSVAAVLAAQLDELSANGFTLRWITNDGGHDCPVSFVRTATSPADLAVLLRTALH